MRRIPEKIPERVRLPTLTAIYGLAGGLVTVAFMLSVIGIFTLHDLLRAQAALLE